MTYFVEETDLYSTGLLRNVLLTQRGSQGNLNKSILGLVETQARSQWR